MSFKWREEELVAWPGSHCNIGVRFFPGDGMKWRGEALKFKLEGILTTRATHQQDHTSSSTIFYQDDPIPQRGVPMFEQGELLKSGRLVEMQFILPEDPNFRNLLYDPDNIWGQRGLARVLPPTGPIGDRNDVSYRVVVEIIDDVSRESCSSSWPVNFSLSREDFDPSPEKRTMSQVRLARPTESPAGPINLSLEYPTSIAVGRPFALSLRGLRLKNSGASRDSDIKLGGISIVLTEHTTIRPDDAPEMHHQQDHIFGIREFPGDQEDPMPILDLSPIDLAAYLWEPTLSAQIPPSFSMPAATRRYGLRVRLQIGTEHLQHLDFDFLCGDVKIHSGKVGPLADAQFIDEHWHMWHFGDFPDEVRRVRAELGIPDSFQNP